MAILMAIFAACLVAWGKIQIRMNRVDPNWEIMTVAELKKVCELAKLPQSGRKAELQVIREAH